MIFHTVEVICFKPFLILRWAVALPIRVDSKLGQLAALEEL